MALQKCRQSCNHSSGSRMRSRSSMWEARRKARLAVISLLYERMQASVDCRGRGVSRVIDQLVADYNAGLALAEPAQRALIPHLSSRTVWVWRRAVLKDGEAALADHWGTNRRATIWEREPELKLRVVRLYEKMPGAPTEKIRDQLAIETAGRGLSLPSEKTIRRFLKPLREADGTPLRPPGSHSRRSFFERFPIMAEVADGCFAADPNMSIDAVRERLKIVAAAQGFPVPNRSTIERRRRRLQDAP